MAQHAPVGRRFLHGFRLGYSYTANFDKPTRKDGTMSLKDEFGIKTSRPTPSRRPT